MSTSPSWFDQDKFSRLVKKVGPKTAAKPPAASQSVPENKAPSQPLVKEAQIPAEEKASPSARKAPPTQPPGEATRLSQRIPKIELNRPQPEEKEEKLIPAPLQADAGPLPTQEIEEEAPPLPAASSLPRNPSQRMMTSQSLSLGRNRPTPPLLPKTPPKEEPIRAPETSSSFQGKTPPLPEGTPTGLPRRTAPLPALKSLFQYEIPGGQGTIPAKPAFKEEEPAAPKSSAPSFSFKIGPKSTPEIPPPAPDEEEHIPSFAGLSDAEDLAEAAEPELSAENLAADWGKSDQLKEELERVIKERDEARAKVEALSQRLPDPRKSSGPASAADSEELLIVIKERDQVRGDYIKLREDFENLKQEQIKAKNLINAEQPKSDEELEELRQQLAEREHEVKAAKTASIDLGTMIQKLKDEITNLRGQVKQARDEASTARESETKLRDELAAREQEIQTVKTSATDTGESLQKLTDELSGLREQLKQAKDEASVAKEAQIKLRNELADKEREVQTHKTASTDAGDALQKLKDELSGVREQLKQAKDEASAARDGQSKLRDELAEMEREIQTAKTTATGSGESLQKLQDEVSRLQDEIKQAKDEAAAAQGNLSSLRDELAEKSREIESVKIASYDKDAVVDKLKEELAGVRNEVKKAQNEASVAQRGLALSQKALQDTREALREASEGSASTKSSFGIFKSNS
jgi:chromosome segregation ATPase